MATAGLTVIIRPMEAAAPFIHSVEVADPAKIDRGTFPWTLPPVAALADGLTRVESDDAGPVSLTRGFLVAPERFLSLLMD